MFVALVVVQELCRCTLSSTRWLTRAQPVEPTLASAGAVIQDQCGTNLAVGVSVQNARALHWRCLGTGCSCCRLCYGSVIRRGGNLIGGHRSIPSTGLSHVINYEACKCCHTSRTRQEPGAVAISRSAGLWTACPAAPQSSFM